MLESEVLVRLDLKSRDGQFLWEYISVKYFLIFYVLKGAKHEVFNC